MSEPATAELHTGPVDAGPSVAGACWTCGKARCFGAVEHLAERLRWAARTARHAQPKTFTARLRLLWHDFVTHGLLHRGGERCQDCGRRYSDWRAAAGDWQRVMGAPSGLLCNPCFNDRREATMTEGAPLSADAVYAAWQQVVDAR